MRFTSFAFRQTRIEYKRMRADPDGTIHTARLVLRPIVASDVADVLALAGDWDVARMLADMPFPMTADLAGMWVHSAAGDGSFAITLGGRVIGGLSMCPIAQDHLTVPAELGFWLGKPWWGHGFAREAAGASIALHLLTGNDEPVSSGHFADNPASGRVLQVLGFAATGSAQQWCIARQETVSAIRYVLPGRGCALPRGAKGAMSSSSMQS